MFLLGEEEVDFFKKASLVASGFVIRIWYLVSRHDVKFDILKIW